MSRLQTDLGRFPVGSPRQALTEYQPTSAEHQPRSWTIKAFCIKSVGPYNHCVREAEHAFLLLFCLRRISVSACGHGLSQGT